MPGSIDEVINSARLFSACNHEEGTIQHPPHYCECSSRQAHAGLVIQIQLDLAGEVSLQILGLDGKAERCRFTQSRQGQDQTFTAELSSYQPHGGATGSQTTIPVTSAQYV